MERLMSLLRRPTAVLVANNEVMAGALLAIRRQQIKIPRDLSLIGFDDARPILRSPIDGYLATDGCDGKKGGGTPLRPDQGKSGVRNHRL